MAYVTWVATGEVGHQAADKGTGNATHSPDRDRTTWHVGQRVARKNTQELGTVVEHNGSMKVKWDGGRTSYFRHSENANVKLKEAPAKE